MRTIAIAVLSGALITMFAVPTARAHRKSIRYRHPSQSQQRIQHKAPTYPDTADGCRQRCSDRFRDKRNSCNPKPWRAHQECVNGYRKQEATCHKDCWKKYE